MRSQLNGSSYYRANPYYQQGFVPESAMKNRKSPLFSGEIPQGQKYFQSTNKKHFQRVGYYSTIGEEQVINRNIKQSIFSPTRDGQFVSSLNINDIEGASPNTLISQAVKNRMKAKQQLLRRQKQQKDEQERQKIKYFIQIENDRKRNEALNSMKVNNITPNYHQMIKKMRTQESDMQPFSPKEQTKNNQISNKQQDYQCYLKKLKNTDYQIQELEKQLSLMKGEMIRDVSQSNHDNMRNQTTSNQLIQDIRLKKQNINQQQNNHQDQFQDHPRKYKEQKRQHNFQQNNKNKNESYEQAGEQIYSQLRNNSCQYDSNCPKHSSTDKTVGSYQFQQNIVKKQRKLNQQLFNAYQQRPLNDREVKQQHRRFNPTFLSYGSASIGLAGRNIVSY